ncbi:MAG: hypothetical protein ACRDZX_15380, partial [Acidimicrobiales bacterium]
MSSVDPTGHAAAAVEEYSGAGTVFIAVQPSRFAEVASWPAGVDQGTIDRLMSAIDPSEHPPVTIVGDAFRVGVDVNTITHPGEALDADLVVPGTGVVEVDTLATLIRPGRLLTAETPVSGCPCRLQGLSIAPPHGSGVSGTVTLTSIQVLRDGHWVSIPAGLVRVGAWTTANPGSHFESVRLVPQGTKWRFKLGQRQSAFLAVADRPDPLPAVTAGTRSGSRYEATGLDGAPQALVSIGRVPAVPGSPAGGSIVDLTYAQLAAAHGSAAATDQVWV